MKMNVATVLNISQPPSPGILVRCEATVEIHLKIPKMLVVFQQLFIVGRSAVRLQSCQTLESSIAR